LKYLLSRASSSLYLNMFGYDDEELNEETWRLARSVADVTACSRPSNTPR
jgi:hypothetical protein